MISYQASFNAGLAVSDEIKTSEAKDAIPIGLKTGSL